MEGSMSKTSELIAQARRARRLAEMLSRDDRERLLAHADELEQQAAELEGQPATVADDMPPGPIVRDAVLQVQQQQQQQQAQDAEPKADDLTDPERSP
jgi:hypothetical protein